MKQQNDFKKKYNGLRHKKIKPRQEVEKFHHCKASREREFSQLKNEGKRNKYEMHKLQALNQHYKMVHQ